MEHVLLDLVRQHKLSGELEGQILKYFDADKAVKCLSWKLRKAPFFMTHLAGFAQQKLGEVIVKINVVELCGIPLGLGDVKKQVADTPRKGSHIYCVDHDLSGVK